jgi:uncharacterized damage-inducible protein DinB
MLRFTFVLAAIVLPATVAAQAALPTPRAELLNHFNMSIRKVIALAEAMPADRYTWSPAKDVMPVGQVYAHIARYNFYYPSTALGAKLPAGIGLDTLEAMRDKAAIVRLLRQSADFAKNAMTNLPDAQVDAATRLYGRTIPGWGVMLQLVAHMNEHLGQSIAYARSNQIVPPWSQ